VCFVVTSGVPFDPPMVLLWTVTAAIAFSVGRRAVWMIVLDFLPLAAVLLAWVYLRGAATSFGMPTLWTPQVAFDRHLFLGVEPTVWLQSHLRYATPRWWDVPITICYLSFFVLPLGMAAVFWLRSRVDYYRWVGRYFALSFLAFGCFAVFPSAPPWMAARCSARDVAAQPGNPACLYQPASASHDGLLGAFPFSHSGVAPYVQKSATKGLPELHLTLAQRLIDHGARSSDLLAAVPSLHAGASMLIAIFLWPRVRRALRVLLAGYPLFMGFTLVYGGEHYVFDILTGWVAAGLVCIAAARVERRWRDAETSRDAVTATDLGMVAVLPTAATPMHADQLSE
jgi:hypothetical protein